MLAECIFAMQDNDLISKGQIWRLVTPALLHGPLYHITVRLLVLGEITIILYREWQLR